MSEPQSQGKVLAVLSNPSIVTLHHAIPGDIQALRHQNARRPIGKLTAELYSNIFEYAALMLAQSSDWRAVRYELLPALMGSCSMIRDAALSTPFLWSFISAEPNYLDPHDRRWEDVRHNLNEVATHIARSAALELSISVFLRHEDRAGLSQTVSSTLGDMLQSQLHRCRIVDLIMAYEEDLPSFFPLNGTMPRLRLLGVSLMETPVSCAIPLIGASLIAPQLHVLKCDFSHISAGPPHSEMQPEVQKLDIHTASLLSATVTPLKMLSLCALWPNLRNLRIRSRFIDEVSATVRIVEFPYLRVLSLQAEGSLRGAHRVKALNLEHLEIEAEFSNSSPVLPEFADSCRFPELKTLQLQTWKIDARYIDQVGTLNPSIEMVSVMIDDSDSEGSDARLMIRSVHGLVQMLTGTQRNGELTLPRLSLLRVKSWLRSAKHNVSCIAVLVDGLLKREKMGSEVEVEWMLIQREMAPTPKMQRAVARVSERWRWQQTSDPFMVFTMDDW